MLMMDVCTLPIAAGGLATTGSEQFCSRWQMFSKHVGFVDVLRGMLYDAAWRFIQPVLAAAFGASAFY